MTNEEVFRSQWLRLKEEVVEQINYHISHDGTVPFAAINQFYKEKTVRWSGYAWPEGRWLEEQKDEASKASFLAKLNSVTLTEVTTNDDLGMLPAIGGLIGGGIAVLITTIENLATGHIWMGWIPRILLILLCIVIPTMIVSSHRKEKTRKRNEQIKKCYVEQIEKAGEELAKIWR